MLHKLNEFYREIYVLGKRIPKRDKFGLYSRIENICLNILELVTTAMFETKTSKLSLLNNARIKIEVLKRLMRTANELKIIIDLHYINLEGRLQEISKMLNGWRNYAAK